MNRFTEATRNLIQRRRSLTAGVEFHVTSGLSLLADARATGFAMSRGADAFGGCSPGTGPAVVGALRFGAAYRFGL